MMWSLWKEMNIRVSRDPQDCLVGKALSAKCKVIMWAVSMKEFKSFPSDWYKDRLAWYLVLGTQIWGYSM